LEKRVGAREERVKALEAAGKKQKAEEEEERGVRMAESLENVRLVRETCEKQRAKLLDLEKEVRLTELQLEVRRMEEETSRTVSKATRQEEREMVERTDG
jgi:hypothetical protein